MRLSQTEKLLEIFSQDVRGLCIVYELFVKPQNTLIVVKVGERIRDVLRNDVENSFITAMNIFKSTEFIVLSK